MRALWVATALAVSVGLTQACSVLLPWDGYDGTGDAPDATTPPDAAPLTDAAIDSQSPGEASLEAGEAAVEGGLTALEVPCGAGLACTNSKACCAYGDGRPWDCANTCPNIGDAGTVLRCDSPTDCTPGARCCSEFTDAGTLERTFCSAACPGAQLRTCDPAFGQRDCVTGSSCTRVIDSGFALTFCEAVRDQ